MFRFAFILALLAAPAAADVQKGGKTVDCYCTDKTGARVELGENICMQVDGKMFMAQCQMSLNNPMWRKLSDGCLSSELADPALQPRPVDAHVGAAKS
ncbi:hypothetical protein DZK27_16690 [Rhodobacteraceae bacterium 63075]|nr:hypothetical protein DZK27_16690 [Rhodobacteraceae bacterium 63075]